MKGQLRFDEFINISEEQQRKDTVDCRTPMVDPCYYCLCNSCINNAESITVNVDEDNFSDDWEACFFCDDCQIFDGDTKKRSMERAQCTKYESFEGGGNIMNIDDLICELFEEPVEQEDNNIVFTSRSVELIHEIAEMCDNIPIVQKTKDQVEDYAKGLSAEQVYVDMLVKIVYAPTAIHMKMSAKMLIPIISQKLKERRL